MLILGVQSEGAPEDVRRECQELANRLGLAVTTMAWPVPRDANSVPEIIQVAPEGAVKRPTDEQIRQLLSALERDPQPEYVDIVETLKWILGEGSQPLANWYPVGSK